MLYSGCRVDQISRKFSAKKNDPNYQALELKTKKNDVLG